MTEKIAEIIAEIKPLEEFDETTDLIQAGILNSLGVMILVAELELTFKVVIASDKINVENFKTIVAIGRMLDNLLNIKPGV